MSTAVSPLVRPEYEHRLEPFTELPVERNLPMAARLWSHGGLRKSLILAVLAAGFATGLASLDAGTVRLAAGALLAFLALCHLPRRRAGSLLVRLRGPLRRVALAAWSFAMSIGHAAGLMLVPALVATCSSAHRFAGAGGPATIAALVGVHTLAMLATSGLLTLLGDRVARRFLDAGGERGTETRRRSD